MNDFLNFNNANKQPNKTLERQDINKIRNDLLTRIQDVLFYLFPNGKVENNKFYIGNIKGEQGKSLSIELAGKRQGSWYDFATNQGGDIINLWQEVMGYSKQEFPKLLTEINQWLGNTPIIPSQIVKTPPLDNLGKPTAKWDYLDQNSKLIAVAYRYDTDKGKQFRIWDVQSKKAQAPDIRPLYNIPNIISAKKVIIVEGEKSADALIESCPPDGSTHSYFCKASFVRCRRTRMIDLLSLR